MKEVSKECLQKWVLNSSFEQLTMYTCTGDINMKSGKTITKVERREGICIYFYLFPNGLL